MPSSLRFRYFLYTFAIIILCVNLANADRYAVQRRAAIYPRQDTPSSTVTNPPESSNANSVSSNSKADATTTRQSSKTAEAKTTNSANETEASSSSSATSTPSSINGAGVSNFTSPIFNGMWFFSPWEFVWPYRHWGEKIRSSSVWKLQHQVKLRGQEAYNNTAVKRTNELTFVIWLLNKR